MALKSLSRPLMFAALTGVAISGVGGYVWHEEMRPAVLEVYVFQLKGAPIIFIRTPEDKRILVNGGANSDVIREITKILPFYSRRIDSVIASKGDSDHVSGLVDVISRYLISQAYIPAITLNSSDLASSTDAAYAAFLNKLNEIKVTPQQLKAGDSIALDSKVTMNIVFPADPNAFEYSTASAPEILFTLDYGSTSIIFMSQTTAKVQKYIASTSADLFGSNASKALILPVSLAKGSIAPQLIEAMKPGMLIYSQNVKKSPVHEAELLIENKFNLLESGLKIESDGNSIQIKNAL